MSRRRRRRQQPDGAAARMPSRATTTEDWEWKTFPVFFAFSLGALVAALLTLVAPSAFYIFLVTALFLSLFGVAHFFGRSLREYRAGDDDNQEGS